MYSFYYAITSFFERIKCKEHVLHEFCLWTILKNLSLLFLTVFILKIDLQSLNIPTVLIIYISAFVVYHFCGTIYSEVCDDYWAFRPSKMSTFHWLPLYLTPGPFSVSLDTCFQYLSWVHNVDMPMSVHPWILPSYVMAFLS